MREQSADVCAVPEVHPEQVAVTRRRLPDERTVHEAAALFCALADPTRLKILLALAAEELCVCDVAAVLGLSVSATSHQLRVLRNLNLVSYRTDGRMVFYALRAPNPVVGWIEQCLAQVRPASGSDPKV